MKQRKLFVSLLVVMALVFALTGCFLKENDTIEMVNAPKVDYTQIALHSFRSPSRSSRTVQSMF